jgi:HPt (histidine-containing phosphotransfer) domain-containing protein
METTPRARLANVVNASVTMFFQSVQPIRARRLPATDCGSDAMPENSPGPNSPLDRVHLARQCLGDRELEDELLGLFRMQARALTAELSQSGRLSLEEKAKIAHTLRGSALAVGAGRIASAARRFEELASTPGDQRSTEARAIDALVLAVAEALAEIERIRD